MKSRIVYSLHRAALCTLVGLALAAVPALGYAQDEVDVGALWDQYDTQATTYEALQTECDEGDRATTYINRKCREAAEASIALADTIELLIEHDDELAQGDRELLIDGMLTNRQIAGALWVELGECAGGRDILAQVHAHPDLPERPLVLQATETWLQRANECIAAEQGPSGEPVAVNRTGPIVLMSSGLAVLLGGVVWDIAQGGNRRDYTDLEADCTDLDGCLDEDLQRLNEVADSLDSAKAPIAIMYGAGAAIAVGGAVWYALAGKSGNDEPEVVLAPSFGRDRIGATLRWQF